MGRKFPPTHTTDINNETYSYKKVYKSIFCLKCFNAQSQVLNVENLFKQASSSYGIPISCFKTLSHLRGPCKLHCYIEKDVSTQNLNLQKLTKFVRLSETQRIYWSSMSNAAINYRAIRVKSLGVTASESHRLAVYRNRVLETTLLNDITGIITITYDTGFENQRDEEEERSRDKLLPSRTDLWTRIRLRMWTQHQRMRRRQQSWRENVLTSRIETELQRQEVTHSDTQTRDQRRQELETLLESDGIEILTDRYFPR